MSGHATAPPFPEVLLGSGLYKLGYVTNDRDAAIELLTAQCGFEGFAPFEPAFEVARPDGSTAPARLRCAFSVGRHNVLEVMEPVEGEVDLWAAPLRGASDLVIHFHHVGLVTDDLDGVRAAAASHGIQPALEASMGSDIEFAYLPIAPLGHLVEHIQYRADAAAFLRDVRTRPITTPSEETSA